MVFLGENDTKMIYERRTRQAIKLDDSSIPIAKRFTFYDQARALPRLAPHPSIDLPSLLTAV